MVDDLVKCAGVKRFGTLTGARALGHMTERKRIEI